MYKHILVPIDLSEPTSWNKTLPTSIQLCDQYGAELHVMTVLPDFQSSLVGSFFPANFEKDAFEEVKKQLKTFVEENIPSELKVQRIIANGVVYDEILRMSDELNIDLIVMCAHRPSLEDYLLGPNAARVVRHAKCSVFVVRD